MIFQFILFVITLLCLINYMVDFVFFLRDRYCRFHIGRYENISDWQKKVEKKAVRWLRKTPTVKITDNSRYILLDYMTGKYRSHTIQSWQKAALILGLMDSNNEEYKKQVIKTAKAMINEKGQWKRKPVAVDCGMLSYALLKVIEDPDAIKPAMDESLSIILNSINEEGMVSYTGGRDNPDMYVDTIGLVCPFLMLYSRTYCNEKLEDIAFKQIDLFHKYGLFTKTSLPNHAFHIRSKLPLGVYGWGRGTAWYIIGLLDSYPLFKQKAHKEKVEQWLIEAADSYLSFQRKDGGFGAILQRSQTYDSSATCVMAWFYAEMSKMCKSEKYDKVSKRCLKKIICCTRITGAIDLCQGDTKDIGVFSQTYGVMPFAQGMILRALNKNR